MPPAGRFVLPEGDGKPRHVVAFAAGAGITPVIAMIQHALANEPATSFTLFTATTLGASSSGGPERPRRHLDRLRCSCSHATRRARRCWGRITSEGDGAGRELFNPPGARLLAAPADDQEARALLALGAVQRSTTGLRAWGSASHAGGGNGALTLPLPAEERGEGTVGTEAIAVLDGIRHRFTVPPGGHVVDAALAAGIRVPYSCKGGMCCTCRARLVEGKAEMTTNYSLEPWEIERGFILTCQAVPKSERLVVDYDQM
jgi:ring-1,2-phenylacetyl-CoA epoxidase subunit PaaE